MTVSESDNIVALLERLSRVLQNESHAEGLKPTQWEALRYLERANRFSRTPSGLTSYLGMTKGTVSQTLNALERKGLIRKTADKADRRQVHIDLTAKAKKPAQAGSVDRDHERGHRHSSQLSETDSNPALKHCSPRPCACAKAGPSVPAIAAGTSRPMCRGATRTAADCSM